ncbi:arsenite methyltransferase [Nocardia sp. CNY236]|uniref:arsenite methyltransferase n=1 Tax=Nocardia sp. CNY236 TaxID=1169152 RepID=UPI00048A84DC|nr:arsenite methyltransferase [Nocardia sp. CNY236]
MSRQDDELRESVRVRYAAAAATVTEGGASADCCGSGCRAPDAVQIDTNFGAALYDAVDRGALPIQAVTASLGCGTPTAGADLREGERVLDLGSGGGIDVLLSARRVGPTGRAFGVDMTGEMLALARDNATQAGVDNVEFLEGTIESIPLPANSIDVVISNCVINLSTDKPAVFAEMARVLVPGGRINIADVVAEDTLTPAERGERGDHVGCIAGALSFTEYRDQLAAAGFAEIEITPTHAVADKMHSVIVQAVQPGGDRG